jgi:formylglycine-generating enzyme required for sulfatase activity
MWNEATGKAGPGNKIMLDAAPLAAAGGLAKLLSAHADAVVAEAAPDPEQRYAVERLFRALTDLNVEGRAIRRPQAFGDLVALTDIGADKLRGIVDALRRDGVSFLTPYAPQPIAEKTLIDISHEALIRCWRRLADPQDGWLKREFDDGLIWRSLLVEAKWFERDERHILSPATTEERRGWWQERRLNAHWATRYGDRFELAQKLIDSSRSNFRRKRIMQYAFIAVLLVTSFAGIAYTNETNRLRVELITDLYVRRTVLSIEQAQTLKPKEEFRECTRCPAMVVVRAGEFTTGSPVSENGRGDNENPQQEVVFAKPFAVSKFDVTFDEWDACYKLRGCLNRSEDNGWGLGNRPAINISWKDARQYVDWLSKQTGRPYRLLSEAEWEYAARAGSTTPYPWGVGINQDGRPMANCDGCGSEWDNRKTAPVGSFPPNGFGLYDMNGNVWQWVEDCWNPNYNGAPTDGSAWASGDCNDRVVRGGSFNFQPQFLRSASRNKSFTFVRDYTFGFRVGRTLTP